MGTDSLRSIRSEDSDRADSTERKAPTPDFPRPLSQGQRPGSPGRFPPQSPRSLSPQRPQGRGHGSNTSNSSGSRSPSPATKDRLHKLHYEHEAREQRMEERRRAQEKEF